MFFIVSAISNFIHKCLKSVCHNQHPINYICADAILLNVLVNCVSFNDMVLVKPNKEIL